MAFDGFTLSSLVKELKDKLEGGRVFKVTQPEKDEIVLNVKKESSSYRLFISCNASYPLIYLSDESKASPMTAPTFCMLLRKHLQNGRIISISQPNMERVVDIEIEHMDEMGDIKPRHLFCEFMGKYSNIILVNDEGNILDGLKRISAQISSVREVLPGRKYFIPYADDKLDPLTLIEEDFFTKVFNFSGEIFKALYSSITGLSPLLSNEICERASIDADRPAASFSMDEKKRLYLAFMSLQEEVCKGDYLFAIYQDGGKYEYSAIRLKGRHPSDIFDSPSQMFLSYYSSKEKRARIRQKSSDLRKLVNTYLERTYKKLAIQENDLRKTENRDKYRIYGELLQAFGYSAKDGDKEIKVKNYYDNDNEITIPLKTDLSAIDNAKAYFKRYNKLKRTYEQVGLQLEESKAEALQLESISNSLNIARDEDDLAEIKEELIDLGYIHSKIDKKKKIKSKPLHFLTSDGRNIYVGKNNYQNDELTFKVADNNDWWFHAKGLAGSHVIMKTGDSEPSDRDFEEAAALAAHFSKASDADKVEVDYLKKKDIKKPPKVAPGFVIYNSNYSLIAKTDISSLKEV